MKTTLTLLAAVLLMPPAAVEAVEPPATAAGPGLSVRHGTLMLEGKPYRGMGMNYVQCFWQVLRDPHNRDFVDGFRILREDYQIPFIRFAASPYHGKEWQLYAENPEEYFRRMDLIIREAEKRSLGLVPCLFWWKAAVGDWCQEPLGEMGNAGSKTRGFYRQYAGDVVKRYKDSPAIWGWEIGNEYMLGADLPGLDHLQAPPPGSKTPRTAADKLTRPMIVDLYRELHTVIREIDPRRIIATGDAMPRSSAWNNRHRDAWGIDSRQQWLEMFTADTPEIFAVSSVHFYPQNSGYFKDELISLEDLLREVAREARRRGRVVWVGEFGAAASGAAESETLRRMLRSIEESGVELSAPWNFSLPGKTFQPGIDITPANERAWVLAEVHKFNHKSLKP